MTKTITITIRLPEALAELAEELHAAEPEVLERIVQYGITRREIYRGIRERTAEHARENGLRVDSGRHQLLDSEEAAQRRATRGNMTGGDMRPNQGANDEEILTLRSEHSTEEG